MAGEERRSVELAYLHPAIRSNVKSVLQALNDEGHGFALFEAYRTPQRQAWLYGQGRTRSGNIVTFAPAWTSYHQYGLAVDIVLKTNGAWDWTTSGAKAAAWKRLHEIGRKHGLEPLKFEMPHLQMAGLKIDDLRAGRLPGGGDDSWGDNLEAVIAGWSGSPAAPKMPAAITRPPLPGGGTAFGEALEVDRPASSGVTEQRPSDTFALVQPFIEKWEGGYVNHPRDKGGPTNMGITQRTLAAWRQREVSENDVKQLTREEARRIMKANYFDVVRGDDLPLPVAAVVYNAAVLHGTRRGGEFLQTAAMRCGADIGADGVDGIVGPDTLGAVAQIDARKLCQAFIGVQDGYFRAHADFAVFGKGWLNRLNDLTDFVAKLPATASVTATGDIPMQHQPINPQMTAQPIQTQANTAQPNVVEIFSKVDELLKMFGQAANAPIAAPTPQPVVPLPVQGVSPDAMARIGAIIALLRQLGAAGGGTMPLPQPVPPPPPAPAPLTPVNGALGQTIGRALDGRKTGIGIIGSVLTGLLGAMAPAAGAGGAAAGAGGLLGTLLPIAGVAVPYLQPIMLGLAAWGALGKMDKWAAARPGAPKV